MDNCEKIYGIGMNFQNWCALDEEDERIMNLKLKVNNQVKHFRSTEEITMHEMFLLQESFIDDISLRNNEWYIDLYFPH